ncbi:hypothetical protein AB0I55_10130 [Actinocatenispora sera]
MKFRFGRKSEKRTAAPAPGTAPQPRPQTGLKRVMAEVGNLAAASSADIRDNFDRVRDTWGAREVLDLTAEELRLQVTDILTTDRRAGFTETMVDADEGPAQPNVQFNTISIESGTGRFYRIMRREDGRYALFGHEAMYRNRQSGGRARQTSGATYMDVNIPVRFLIIARPDTATKLLRSLLEKGMPATLFEMDFGVGELKCVGMPSSSASGNRPDITISESQTATSSTGEGTRGCTKCQTRWKSVYGELQDSTELTRLAKQGDVSVNASRDQIIGLTCISCRESVCINDLGQQLPSEGLAKGNVTCPSCAGHLYYA